MRKMNIPPFFVAHRKLCSAARILPTWSRPVGEGAKRVMTVMRRRLARRRSSANYILFVLPVAASIGIAAPGIGVTATGIGVTATGIGIAATGVGIAATGVR